MKKEQRHNCNTKAETVEVEDSDEEKEVLYKQGIILVAI